MCIAQPFSRIEVHSKASIKSNYKISYIYEGLYVCGPKGTCAYLKHVAYCFCVRYQVGTSRARESPISFHISYPCGGSKNALINLGITLGKLNYAGLNATFL